MLFADLFFLFLFLPLCLTAYFSSKNVKWRNLVLIVFSLVFYAWGEPFYVLLLILSVVINYLLGRVIGSPSASQTKKKAAVLGAVITDLALLGVFKYSGFLVENLNLILPVDLPVPAIRLPIGISFYTFQAISYVVDVYWERTEMQKSFWKFLLYISMFPQLIAGPIVRYTDIAAEIDERHASVDDIYAGMIRVICGLAKKVVIANSLSTVVEGIFAGPMTLLAAWTGAAVFALQVYFDFSVYSDFAIGLGRIFGFHFNENFNYPFVSTTIGEFWQRWHISLGSFFRDYLLMIPIFGKRRGYLNLFIVWFCTGLWHGASWNFILWGVYFGLFILAESLIGKKKLKRVPRPLMHIYTKLVLIVGFGIFYFEDIGALGTFFGGLVGVGGLYNKLTMNVIVNNCFLIAAAILLSLPVLSYLRRKLPAESRTLVICESVCCVVLLFLSATMLVNATNNPFLYFRW